MTARQLLFSFSACLGLLASTSMGATAEAGRHLGIPPEAAPAPPTDKTPTMSLNQRRRKVADGDLPEMLLPVPYTASGWHFSTRWYDENGQVYRSREVAMVLRAAEAPQVDHHLQWRQYLVAASVLPVTFGLPLLAAGDQLALGVENFNYHQAAAVRKTTATAMIER